LPTGCPLRSTLCCLTMPHTIFPSPWSLLHLLVVKMVQKIRRKCRRCRSPGYAITQTNPPRAWDERHAGDARPIPPPRLEEAAGLVSSRRRPLYSATLHMLASA
jgi:hypothetical protein